MILGVGTHVIDYPGAQGDQLDLAQKIGFDSVRSDAPWKEVEPEKGKYKIPAAWDQFVDSANTRGLKPILILDYGNANYDGGDKPRSTVAIDAFVRYATFVAQHFHGRVQYYEVWNEWDNHTGGFPAATAEDYAKLFKATYPALKQADPNAIVLSGAGVRPGWVESLARLGVISEADGVAVHPYNYQIPGNNGPELYASALRDLNGSARSISGRSNVDFYVTEIGWPSHTGKWGRSESDVAAFAGRVFSLSATLPFIKGVWWYDLKNDGNDKSEKEQNFGLVNNDLSPKAATAAVVNALAKLRSQPAQ